MVATAAGAQGAAVRFVGQVGRDPVGDLLVAELRTSGVEPCVTRGGRTGTLVVLEDPSGLRSELLDRGAATSLASWPPSALDDVCVLYVPLSALTAEPVATAVFSLIGEAVDRGIALALDTESPSVVADYGADEVRALAAQLRPTVVFSRPGDEERFAIGGRHALEGATTTITFRGAEPVVLAGFGLVRTVSPAPGCTITTGAAERFAAGYLVGMLAGDDIVANVRRGLEVATAVAPTPAAPGRGADESAADEASTHPSTAVRTAASTAGPLPA